MTIIFFLLSMIGISKAQPTSGIFKMGLKSFTYTDSLASKDKGVIYVLNRLKKSSEQDLYFSPDESMIINKVEDAIKKEIYDQKNNIIYTLMEKGKMKWYSVDSFPKEMFNQSDTSAEYQDLLKSIEISSASEDQKILFGFRCDKVTVHDPDNPSREVIFYRTSKISVAQIMDPMSHFIPGVSLETTFYSMPGFTPTTGAISFSSKKFRKKHFGIDLKKYKKVTPTELELEIWDLN